LQRQAGEFVVWDIGLGAAANAITVLRAARDIPSQIRLLSFDHSYAKPHVLECCRRDLAVRDNVSCT